MHEARGIEQDVGFAGALGHGGNRGAVAGVEFCNLGNAFALQRGELAFIDVGGEHRGALARKCHSAGTADSNGGGGNEGALALQAI